MKMNLITKIVIGIAVGIVLGLYSPMPLIKTLSSVGFVLGQYIKFIIPLLIIAFVAKGIADYGQGAGRALILGLVLAYTSTIAAELLTFFVGSFALVHTGIVSAAVAWSTSRSARSSYSSPVSSSSISSYTSAAA